MFKTRIFNAQHHDRLAEWLTSLEQSHYLIAWHIAGLPHDTNALPPFIQEVLVVVQLEPRPGSKFELANEAEIKLRLGRPETYVPSPVEFGLTNVHN